MAGESATLTSTTPDRHRPQTLSCLFWAARMGGLLCTLHALTVSFRRLLPRDSNTTAGTCLVLYKWSGKSATGPRVLLQSIGKPQARGFLFLLDYYYLTTITSRAVQSSWRYTSIMSAEKQLEITAEILAQMAGYTVLRANRVKRLVAI